MSVNEDNIPGSNPDSTGFPNEKTESPPEEIVSPEEKVRKQELLSAAKKIVRHRKNKKSKPDFDWSAQGHFVLSIVLLAIIVLYAAIGICRSRMPEKDKTGLVVTAESLLPTIIDYGGEKIPGKVFVKMEATRTDRDPELVEEIRKVIDEKGMPADIFQDDIPPEMNLGTELSRAFEIYKNNPGELEQLREKSPRGEWKIGREALQEVGDILTRTEQKRLDIREMLNKNDVCFSFAFVHDPDYGDIPDTSASDFLSDYLLLEEFAVAKALDEGRVEAATESLAYMFRMAQLAAEVKNVTVRTKAGEVRMKTMDVMQGVVLDPKFRESDMIYLLGMLQEQLDAWTPESAMWIGDRASGLVVFNLIRQHGLESALEPDEIAELRQRGIFDSFSKGLLTNLPKDQAVYLRMMQRIIEESQNPFYQRVPELKRIEAELRGRRGAVDEPVISEILLRGTTEIMKYCAQDRAKCEMAVLAMAASLGKTVATAKRPHETLELDPLFGRKYEILKTTGTDESKADFVRVSFHSNLKPFRVPDFSKGK